MTTNSTATFPLGDILNITTGRLVTNMDGIYTVLNHMTSDDLMTHALPRASNECRPHLLAQHPQLEGIDLPQRPEGYKWTAEEIEAWVTEQEALFGTELPVSALPAGDHTVIDPFDEWALIKGQK